MAFSNVIALAIIITTAATLHKSGVTTIKTSTQAAEALRPIAGAFTFAVFALGIIGTGVLAIPVLGGSAAYAVSEGRKWPVGLSREPKEAVAFYSILAAATLLGAAITLSPIDPIQALFWSAVINGVVTVPVMVAMMWITADRRVMGKFTVTGGVRWLGWLSTALMMLCVFAMIASWAL